MTCAVCGATLPSGKPFCADCGSRAESPAGSAADVTRTVAVAAAAPASHVSRSSSGSLTDSSVDEGSYIPGTIILERYRVTGLLGRGGMGEVYRATDLKLGQQVALKFLPQSASLEAIERFRGEVRIARQISHRNVCRVYDIGEVNGCHFLSMEYVQGEDLAMLLRRIGHLPGDKALEISQQLCAGLAAAHAKGVIHRDLKPSNVLINGEGSVVIVDFGLAAAQEIRAGTPAYMAPEQLEGREVTVRSDIYSLGLVLYELYTGHRALKANTLAELQEQHQAEPERPSTFIEAIDPAVERVILQCLAPDPEMRPTSVGAVAASLPGGDPLAAALAAGETPSPELVAAAGKQIGITPVAALGVLAAAFVTLALVWVALANLNTLDSAGIDLSPEVMADRTRTLVSQLGYAEKPADEAWSYRPSSAYLKYRQKNPETTAAFPHGYFWYRSSPDTMGNFDPTQAGVVIGAVTDSGPPMVQSGMIEVHTDGKGRLLRFRYVTPEKEAASPDQTKPIDWNATLRAAGYDPAKFTTTLPEWLPDGAFDTRAAWTGEDRQIEAASWKGRLVYFQTVFPWTQPERQPSPKATAQRFTQIFAITLLALLIGAASFMVRRNLKAGRGDRKGATRLAGFVFVVHMAAFFIGTHHVAGLGEVPLIGIAVAFGLLKAAMLWLVYLAVEPAARRRWPHSLISWTRLLSGRWTDPLVGRDTLLGILACVLACGPLLFLFWDQAKHGDISAAFPSVMMLGSVRKAMASMLNTGATGIMSTLMTFLILFLVRTVLRRDWIAVVVCGMLFALPAAFNASLFAVGFAAGFLVNVLAFFVGARYGLTALCAYLVLLNPLLDIPATMNLSAWYAANGLVVYVAVAGIALIAFRTALAGRPVFRLAEEL